MADKKTGREIDAISGVETTGHQWDGIKELNTPLPRWWLWTFYATIVWAIGYTIAYPAWPLISSNTKGLLGYSSRGEYAAAAAVAEAAKSTYLARIASGDIDAIAADPELSRFATAAGASLFKDLARQRPGSRIGSLTRMRMFRVKDHEASFRLVRHVASRDRSHVHCGEFPPVSPGS